MQINYFGVDRRFEVVHFELDGDWTRNVGFSGTFNFVLEVPTGYDGIVIAFSNPVLTREKVAEGIPIGDSFDDDTLFFRLRG